MRQDMCKLFSEEARRPDRPVANKRARYFQRTPLDELPAREGMLARWNGYRKEGCWNCKPLKAFLAASVGRQWNEVFSEICQHTSVNNYVQQRMREALVQQVLTNIEYRENEPFTTDGFRVYPGEFWVDPKTGKLCLMSDENRQVAKWQWRTRFVQVPVDAEHKYVLINGCWFLVTLQALPSHGDSPYDVVLKPDLGVNVPGLKRKKKLPPGFYTNEWRAPVWAAAKRQLSGDAVRRLKKSGVLPA